MRENVNPGIMAVSPIFLLALFFISGFTALVYEVLWLKNLVLLFGNTSFATAAILSTFFMGLAAGSSVWGRRCVKDSFPLRTYAMLEAGIALSASFYFLLVKFYYFIYPFLFQLFGSYPHSFLIVKLFMAMTILFPPAFFMGGTFPVMSQCWVRNPDSLGHNASLLYAVNTFGAALGSYTAGFHLPVLFGYRNSYLLAIATTGMVAVLALFASRYPNGSVRLTQPKVPTLAGKTKTIDDFSFPIIWVLSFLSGFAALSLEVLWTRMFAQVLQNSVYSFSMILSVFIISLSFGALLASFLAKSEFPTRNILSVLLSISGFLVGLTPIFFTYITNNLGYQGREIDILHNFISIVLIIFVPGIFLGSVFPFLLKLSEPLTTKVGNTVGYVTAFNTAGGFIGALFTGFLLLDSIGLWSSVRVMAVLYLLGALLVSESIHTRKFFYRLIPILGILFMVSVFEMSRLPLVKINKDQMDEYLVEAWEGSASNVAVINSNGFLKIVLNNHYTLGGVGYRKTEEFQSHLPLLLHPKPDSVFFIGMGTGITAGASLQHPVKNIVVSELNPEVVEASKKYFEPYTQGLFRDSRVRVVREDGRNYLMGTKETFDLIISDLFLPWKSGVGNLYSQEHYEAVLSRLNPGGLFAQWMPLYQLAGTEFGTVVKTMLNSFPMVTLWRGDFFSLRDVVLLMGHKSMESLNPKALEERFMMNPAPQSVKRNYFTSTQTFPINSSSLPLLYYCGNLSASKEIFDRYPINSDDRPIVEYYAPLLNWKKSEKINTLFVRFELIDFFEQLLHTVPPDKDHYLSQLTSEEKNFVFKGLRMHKASVISLQNQKEMQTDIGIDRLKKEVLTENSVKKLFSPIKSKEEALSYYLFLMKNLGSRWEYCNIYFFKEEDYHSPKIRFWINNPAPFKKALNGGLTKVHDIPGGYLISLIGFNPTFNMEFFERNISIDSIGNINELSQKTLLSF